MNILMAKQLLMSSSYLVLNRDVLLEFGVETALFLSVLTEAEQMLADEKGWFYQTSGTVEKFTGLSRYKQDKAIEQLEAEGILIKEVRGMPGKRYFKFNNEVLANKIAKILQTGKDKASEETQFVNSSQTSVEETNKQDCKKLETNKELSNKELNKESSRSEQKPDLFLKSPPEIYLEKELKELKEKTPTTTDTRILHTFYQKNFGVESPFIAESIEYWVKDLNTELVLEAMKRASLNNSTFRYAEAIMQNWYKHNIRTLEQVEAQDMEFSKKNQKEEPKTEYANDWKDMLSSLDGGNSD